MKLLAILLLPILLFGQTVEKKSKFEGKVNIAYANAMKGVCFALENIPDRKKSVSKELISDNKLIARVKISKEVGGVSVVAVGFYDTFKITAEIYRDYKSLKSEGIIDYIPHQE